MADSRRRGKKDTTPPAPPEPKPEPKSIGVTAVRRAPRRSTERRLDAVTAGEAATDFPKGGRAFARWCQSQGVDPTQKRPIGEWQPLLAKFAVRPIHGHRRGAAGGNHKPTR